MKQCTSKVSHENQQAANSYLTLFPISEIDAIRNALNEIKTLLNEKGNEEQQNEWLPKPEAQRRLHVCKKTLDNYLSKGIIPHARFGGKIYIKAADIQAHLERHYITT
jgi:hypothetical protein